MVGLNASASHHWAIEHVNQLSPLQRLNDYGNIHFETLSVDYNILYIWNTYYTTRLSIRSASTVCSHAYRYRRDKNGPFMTNFSDSLTGDMELHQHSDYYHTTSAYKNAVGSNWDMGLIFDLGWASGLPGKSGTNKPFISHTWPSRVRGIRNCHVGQLEDQLLYHLPSGKELPLNREGTVMCTRQLQDQLLHLAPAFRGKG